ncbi:uncharacterized protein [Rutidosis leptorrhynchoides]|uniref:uncharacterized protein n=1 Tax=Rutidosis leptorrhynchoides TaxID=125765 RepID=UPI003A99FCA0
MENWKDQAYNDYNQAHFTRTKPNSYRKPPAGGSSNLQHNVPSWEKKFCASVGSIPWKKLLETKKCIHLYDNVIKWNDSAGKEAFEKAKNNFYANMYNLPHDNLFPDPDIYIDKINWDLKIDPNLILDLESDAVFPDSNSKDEQVVIFGSSFPPSYQSFSTYGWGDSDDDKKNDKNPDTPFNVRQSELQENEGGVFDHNNNWWGRDENEEAGKKDRGYGDSRNDYWGWNMYDNNNYFYAGVKNERKGGSGRFKGTRVRKDDNQGSRSRSTNGNGLKSSNFCGPVNVSSRAGVVVNRWSVKKPVS